MTTEHIEFEIKDEEKFEGFLKVYELILIAKNGCSPKTDEFWLRAFPDYALKHYFFSDTDLKPGFETANTEGGTWHFYSMLDYLLKSLDAQLLKCKVLENRKGRLDFLSNSYPYGGITGLIMFLNSFECKATKVDEGSGFFEVNWLSETEFILSN